MEEEEGKRGETKLGNDADLPALSKRYGLEPTTSNSPTLCRCFPESGEADCGRPARHGSTAAFKALYPYPTTIG